MNKLTTTMELNDAKLGSLIRTLAKEADDTKAGYARLQVKGHDGKPYEVIIISPYGPEAEAIGANE